jgi:hypothetical protein
MVAEMRKHPELEALEKTYKLENLSLQTIDGMRWKNRMEASEQYFRDYSWDWKDNLQLLSDVRAMKKKWGNYACITYAVVQNFVADTYYRNPRVFVQDRSGNKDLTRILSDLFTSIHKEVNTERKMKEALQDQAWAGFGVIWNSFRMDYYIDEELFDYDLNQQGAVVPTKERYLCHRLSPWRVRFDPDGRQWDLSDHNYVAVLYYKSLAQVMRDPRLSDEDKRRTMAHLPFMTSAFNSANVRYATLSSFKEEDPEYIRIPIWAIWARPDKKVYDQPLGASFTWTPQDWPAEFANDDSFPLLYMAKNREPEDESSLQGFAGIPDIRLIKPHVTAINKLEALFLAANMHVINKYLSVKGVLDDAAKTKLADGVRQFNVIELDKDALNAFPTQMQDKMKFGDVLQLVPQAELKDLHHLEGIRHEMDMISQIIGQGPADRGGVSEADSATESLGMQQGLQRRLSTSRHENGKNFCALTRIMYLILKQRQTLPIRYQMTTAFNQSVWQEFSADTLRDLDLHFEYAVGSSEYRTREQEFQLRERMATILMPIFTASQNFRLQMKVAQDLIEPLEIIGSEQYFTDEAAAAAQQLLAIYRGLSTGVVHADDPRVAKQIPELVAQLAQAILTPQQIAEVEASVAGANPPEQGQSVGSLPAAPTPGQQDYATAAAGSAAAGATGGMPN